MRTVNQIYSEYKIMPGLQMHQLRVAAVAKTICDNLTEAVDNDNIVLSCLLHDMGNIIKSELGIFPEFLEPKGLKHWQEVKDEFIQKYGPNDHEATRAIAQELAVPSQVLSYLDTIGFVNFKNVLDSNSLSRQICSYSDMRAAPHGVRSLEERLEEARRRYAGKHHAIDSEEYYVLTDAVREMERRIFSKATIRPEDITEDGISGTVAALRSFAILHT